MIRTGLATAAACAVVLAGALTAPDAAGATVPAMPYDFDGNGYADLPVGVPGEGGGGVVNVLYGSRDGITAAGDQYWSQDSPGVKGVRQKGDRFGSAVASADFDRDGYADLAIGVPRDPVGSTLTRGAVNVLYGSPAGLNEAGDQRWTRLLLPGEAVGDSFGAALVAGELTGDAYPDLAVGTPDESIVVIPGGIGGLHASGGVVLDPSSTAAPTTWGYGGKLAVGDFDGNGHGDLVIGLPGADVGGVEMAGQLQVVYGRDAGLDVTTTQSWSQDSPGILDAAEIGYAYDTDGVEMFGGRIAVGDFDGDGADDLAVGVPADAGSTGVINVIYGSPEGLIADGNQLWTTSGLSIPGSIDGFDSWGRFGAAVAAGDLNHDGRDDLAVGSPDRSVTEPEGIDAGVVTILYGSPGGLNAAGSTSWTQSSAGVPGSPENSDWFGTTLRIAQVGHSASEDLIVGVPGEGIGSVRSAEIVDVLYGRTSGVSGGLAQSWSQDSAGVKGEAETEEGFGRILGR